MQTAIVQQQPPLEPTSTGSQEIQAALRLYLELLNEIISSEYWRRTAHVSLIYIDDDNIPELVVDGPSNADGSQVYTVSYGELIYIHGSVGGIFFIERQNIFLRSGGRGGHYHDTLYTIDDGEFVVLHEGHFTDMGSFIWDGENVTCEGYSDRLSEAFNQSEASSSWEQAISLEEMIIKITAILSESFVQNDSAATIPHLGEILYYGIPLSKFLGEPRQKWIDTFGEPDWSAGWFCMYEGRFAIFFDHHNYPNKVYSVVGIVPSAVEVNGVSLDRPLNELIGVLGQPSSEFYDEGFGDTWTAGHNYVFDMGHYSVTFTSDSPGGVPNAVSINSPFDPFETDD